MRAATSMMLFSFRRRKQAEDAGERSDKRMLTPVLDSIHGAHLDGGAIVLWKGIGGGSYPAREVGPWIYDETGSGMFRLVYQPTTTIGAPTGPPVATTNEVSRSVALSVIRSQDLSGMLSVYTLSIPLRSWLRMTDRATDRDTSLVVATGGPVGAPMVVVGWYTRRNIPDPVSSYIHGPTSLAG